MIPAEPNSHPQDIYPYLTCVLKQVVRAPLRFIHRKKKLQERRPKIELYKGGKQPRLSTSLRNRVLVHSEGLASSF